MGKRVLMGLHASQTNPTEDWSQYLSIDSLDALSADSLLTVLATDSVATGAADAHKVFRPCWCSHQQLIRWVEA